jgi:hypothetical protein
MWTGCYLLRVGKLDLTLGEVTGEIKAVPVSPALTKALSACIFF